MEFDLERVPPLDLHFTRSTVDLVEIRPIARRQSPAQLGIANDAITSLAVINLVERLVVGYIESIEPHLEHVALMPRHFPGFADAKIGGGVVRQAENIARTGFARIGVAEALVNRSNIASSSEELGGGRWPDDRRTYGLRLSDSHSPGRSSS